MASVRHPRESFTAGSVQVDTAFVSEERLGECTCVLTPRGSLTSDAAGRLHASIMRAVGAGCCDFVIDLTEATDVSPYLAIVLLNAQRVVIPDDGYCCVVATDQATRRLFHLSSLASVWPLAPTRAEALAGVLRRPA
jgi:anti-anti-sigma regulatory factor